MKVPGDNVVAMPQAQQKIDPKYLLMAAAQMHTEGRLPESGLTPNQRVDRGFTDLKTPDLIKHEDFGDDTSYLNRRTGKYQFGKVT